MPGRKEIKMRFHNFLKIFYCEICNNRVCTSRLTPNHFILQTFYKLLRNKSSARKVSFELFRVTKKLHNFKKEKTYQLQLKSVHLNVIQVNSIGSSFKLDWLVDVKMLSQRIMVLHEWD